MHPKSKKLHLLLPLFIIGVLLLAACSAETPSQSEPGVPDAGVVDVQYTLKTASEGGRYWFIGVGGDIDGQVNPDLQASVGDTVAITLVNDDGRSHDVVITEFGAATSIFGRSGQEETVVFTADQAGTFFYFCSVGGHRQAGMEGQFIVVAGE